VLGIQPQIGIGALKGAIQKAGDLLVELRADPGDPVLSHAGDAEF